MIERAVGIDLAVRGEHVARIFDDGRPVGKPLRFRLTSASLERFVAAITADLPPDGRITAVMEPTGMAWFPVAAWLGRAGVRVIRVKGQRVRALRKYLSEHAKTDLTDAHVLGALPSFGAGRLDPVFVPSPEQQALQRLTKQRERFEAAACAGKRRLLDLIRWACPALEAVLPDLRTRLSLAILREYLDPRRVLAARRTTLARFIGAHASGNHPHGGPFVDRLVDGLRAAARETIALHGLAVDFEALRFEVRQEIEQLALIERQIGGLARRIEELYARLHPADVLRSIPGIGVALAPVILGVLHGAARFRNGRHLRGFCGMVPHRSAAGGRERPGQRLSQSGNDRIKRALYLAADAARRVDPELAAVYWRLMVTKGHHHKQALCAVTTRSANRIHAVLKTGRPYVLRDTDGRVIDPAEGKRIVAERFTVPEEIRRARRVHAASAAA
jgi:transposase